MENQSFMPGETLSQLIGDLKKEKIKNRGSLEKLCLNRRSRSENEDIIIEIIQENIPELMIMIFEVEKIPECSAQ